jgi:hypothetical protein
LCKKFEGFDPTLIDTVNFGEEELIEIKNQVE